jgi:hypothetical protein
MDAIAGLAEAPRFLGLGRAVIDLADAGEQDARRMALVRLVIPHPERRAHRMRRSAPALILVALSALGCSNSKPDLPEKGPPPLPPHPAAASGAAASESAAPAASIAVGLPAPGESAFAGTWEGSYDARKGAVALPDRVKDKTRGEDDGKLMSGAGKVEITVLPSGDVRGKATGALGEARLTGKLDEGSGFLRASWYPEDATRPNAMTGVLLGPVKNGMITAMIRVAGPDAVLVRESKIELKKR